MGIVGQDQKRWSNRGVTKKRPGEKVAKPRKNFVPAAAEQYSGTFHETMANALANAIKPGIV